MHLFKEIFIPPNVFDDVLKKAKHRTNDASNDVSRPALRPPTIKACTEEPLGNFSPPNMRTTRIKSRSGFYRIEVDYCVTADKILV